MSKLIALDTNILVYLHEPSDTIKRERAIELMAEVPMISSQVVSEYINVLRRLLKVSKADLLREVASWLKVCEIVPVELSTLYVAQELIERYDFQTFDAIIVASALESNCTVLYSEDMQHNLLVEKKLRILNPFKK